MVRQGTDRRGPAMLYAIASITKTFTGTAIMQLRDAGRLDLDDPAVAWLPEQVRSVLLMDTTWERLEPAG